MPFPLPELPGERDGAGAGGVNQALRRERKRRGVKEDSPDVDERDEKQEFERVNEVVGQLRGGDVEAKDESCGETEDGGAAKNGIDADEEADRDAPGEFLRRRPHAQKREDRKRNAAIEPIVVKRCLAGRQPAGIRIARFHTLQDRLRNKGL